MKNGESLSPFQEIFRLQEAFLAHEITEQLLTRDIHEEGLSEKLISLCKSASSEEEFLAFTSSTCKDAISSNFLSSLYHTIRQKLPRKDHLPSQDRPASELPLHSQVEQYPPALFPSLPLLNKDEISLDLEMRQTPSIVKQSTSHQPKNFQSDPEPKGYQRIKKRSKSRSRDRKAKKHKHRRRDRNSSSSESEGSRERKVKHKRHEESKAKIEKASQAPKETTVAVADGPVVVGEIYRARIASVGKTGLFVKLVNSSETRPGIIHSSRIRDDPITNLAVFFKPEQFLWCKVLEILPDRIRLSIKEIKQYDGKEINRKQRPAQMASTKVEPPPPQPHLERETGMLTGIKIEHHDQVNEQGQASSYADMWEDSRMSYMTGSKKPRVPLKQDIQEINIEMNDRQPPFLTGQTTKTGINLSPVRVVKNPEGTLQRQALNAAQYAKERREIREQQSKHQVRDLAKILDQVTPDQTPFRKKAHRSQMNIKEQKECLPIFQYKSQLVQACMENNILIIIGETGSGKTTQITQYLQEAGFAKRGRIGCTQPRRVAAMSVAKRVCEEMGVLLGQEVGYSIRFEDHTSSRTVIKYMTDGMLLREALVDKYLGQYSVIMLDEAHERTINTDVLFGILKKVVQKRKDFLLIVTSATLQAKKFSSYFFDCKIFSIPGRTYNVEILYAKEPQTDYLDASLMCVMQIHVDEPPGDILLFLTGQEEIDTACMILNDRLRKVGESMPELIILPVYSALPSELQTKIFEPAPRGKRKCVIATNIAEASLTIDGIFYVIDPGFAKIKLYNSKLGMDTLIVAPISQASAKQRAGRAGRTGPGKCYRIYTEEAYRNEMLPTSVPEIQRANLANTVLELKAMGINDLINFDFMDAPPVQTLIVALERLYYLSALDDEGLLTKLGRKMAEFPLEPPLSKMLLTSVDFGCTEEIVTIISMLSVQNIFYRPKEKEGIADQKKTKFNHHEGDHLTYLAVYQGWRQQGQSAGWCRDNYIQERSLRRAQDVKKQILDLLQRYRFPIHSCGANFALIRKTIVAGFFFHAAKKDPKGGYRTLIDDHQVYIHPSSALFNKEPEWVIYHELVFTTKEYMRDVCTINPKWLIDVAPNFFKFTDELGFTRKKRNEKLDPFDQKYGDANAWRLSKRKG